MIEFLPLGGGGEIGANSYYLNLNNTGIILDCGMNPQKKGLESLPAFDLLENKPVDYVLVSHAHQDHLNALPFLVQKFPYIKIITTPQTRAVAELTLHDSVSILRKQLMREDPALYSHEEVDLLIKSILYKQYGEEFELKGYSHSRKPYPTAIFYNAGHIIGSASILIEYDDQKLFYTGDINLNAQSLLPGAVLPKEKISTLILETTYGDTDSSTIDTWSKEAARFAAAANKILSNGGSILVPVFSLGKMQELLATLHKLMIRNKLARTEIYAGGVAEKIIRVYDYNRYVVDYKDPEFVLKDITINNLYSISNSKDLFQEPCIVLASSGMMVEGTASYNLAVSWLRQKKGAVFTVGYMEENTPGYLIANASKGDKIQLGGDTIKVNCDIKRFRFPSHSKREDLLEIVDKLKPANVILVHGSEGAIKWTGSEILKRHKHTKLYAAENGKAIYL